MRTFIHILELIGLLTDAIIIVLIITGAKSQRSTKHKLLSSVKNGEEITLDYGFSIVKAIVNNNSIQKKQMLVYVNGLLPVLLGYSDHNLRNFEMYNKEIANRQPTNPDKNKLNQQLKDAIKQEDYERASKLRDQLKKIK